MVDGDEFISRGTCLTTILVTLVFVTVLLRGSCFCVYNIELGTAPLLYSVLTIAMPFVDAMN